MKHTTKLSLFQIIVRWLVRHYLGVELHSELIPVWVRLVRKRAETRGTVECIAWIKSIRLCYTRFLARQPLSSSPGCGVQVDTFGLPIGIPLTPLFESRDSTLLRFGFTLLGVSRILPGWKSPDLAPITTPGPPLNSTLVDEASGVVSELGWKIERPVWEACHVTTKAGPNAQALIGSVEDASLLTDRQLALLLVLGGETLIRTIELIRLISPLAWLKKFKIRRKGKEETLVPKGRSSRISAVKDKEAKCRVVAILDYWTQSCLKPLHDAEMRFLKSLRPDCTFNQGSFRAKLGARGPYYSYDLSSATDRLPVWLQAGVLASLISKEYADAWAELLVDREYDVTWIKHEQKRIRYACGQPMGAYSSWATFSISHHVIVRMAAKRAGKPVSFSGYVLLGDDIVINDAAVAEHYRAIIESLGVEISTMKSHVSDDTYEFAKRWIHNGTEVTGAPMGSLFESIRTKKLPKETPPSSVENLPTKQITYVGFYGVATWLRELESRWLPPSRTLVSRGLLADFFACLGQNGNPRLADKAWKFFLLPVREDSRALRRDKARILASIVLSDALTCNKISRAGTQVLVLLNECKARVLEDAIKRQIGRFQQFQLELLNFVDLLPEGLDAQSLLLSLPPFAVLRRNVAELQLEFDKAHLVRESDDLMQWLHLDVRLFLDPFEAMSARTSKTVAMSKATILNYLSSMCRGICWARDFVIACPMPDFDSPIPSEQKEHEEKFEAMVRVVQNREVLPTRGDRRKSRRK